MKHNPRVNERVVSLPGFRDLHPCQEEMASQEHSSSCGGSRRSWPRCAGCTRSRSSRRQAPRASSPVSRRCGRTSPTGRVRATSRRHHRRHCARHEPRQRRHGRLCAPEGGTDERGNPRSDDLRAKVDERTAGLMLTNPSTLGLFDEHIEEVSAIFHDAGALLYYDGANLNAVCGISRPGRHGIRHRPHQPSQDVLSQPHGGGGPGGGLIAVRDILEPFPPAARGGARRRDVPPGSRPAEDVIGKVCGFAGRSVSSYAPTPSSAPTAPRSARCPRSPPS